MDEIDRKKRDGRWKIASLGRWKSRGPTDDRSAGTMDEIEQIDEIDESACLTSKGQTTKF